MFTLWLWRKLEEAAVAELVTVLCLILSVRRFGPTKHLKTLRQQTLQVKRCYSNLAEVRTQILLWEETTGEYNNCTWSQEKKLEKVSVILSPCKFEVHHVNNHDRLHIRRKIKINSKVNGLCFIHVWHKQWLDKWMWRCPVFNFMQHNSLFYPLIYPIKIWWRGNLIAVCKLIQKNVYT